MKVQRGLQAGAPSPSKLDLSDKDSGTYGNFIQIAQLWGNEATQRPLHRITCTPDMVVPGLHESILL
jgi:hypothetical protein